MDPVHIPIIGQLNVTFTVTLFELAVIASRSQKNMAIKSVDIRIKKTDLPVLLGFSAKNHAESIPAVLFIPKGNAGKRLLKPMEKIIPVSAERLRVGDSGANKITGS